MKLFLGLVWVLLFGACTTFNLEERGLDKACKSGVAQYDNGSTSFKCKEDKNDTSSDTADQRQDSGRTIK